MAAVSTIRPEVRAIDVPRQLRDLQVWLVWRFEHGEGPKPRKVPYYTNGGRRGGVQGRPEDRARLVTFAAAKAAAAARGFDGVGVAVLPDTGLCWVDFDACADGGEIHPDVERLLAGTYSEFSPSGTGIRAVFAGDLGNRKAEAGGGRWGVETFSSNGFVTVTGNRTEVCEMLGLEDTIAPISEAMRAVASQRFDAQAGEAAEPGEPLGLDNEMIGQALDVLDPDCGYQRWLEIGMALHHERGDDGLDLWDAWSATGGKYPGREVLAAKWESFGRSGRNPVTARRLIRYANEAGAHVELPPQSIDASEFQDISEPVVPGKLARFQVVDAGDYARRAPPAWLIKGVLPRAQLAVVYGASGAGKSFVVIDMAMALARGEAWQGHRCRGGRVVVIAAEGAGGVRNRIAAYQHRHDVDLTGVPLGVIGDQPSFLKASTDHKAIVKQIQAWGGADLVVVDTLAQVTAGGNENSAEDMGAALQRCRAISEACGALVLLVHHAGKDASRGARGWSGIRAAADAEIEIVRDGDVRIVELTKQKDGTDGLRWAFRLEPIVLGLDEDGDEITSCAVDYLPADQVPTKGGPAARRLGKWESLVNAVIQEFAMAQTAGIEVQAVLDEALRRAEPAPEGKRDTRRQHLKRAMDALFSADDAQYIAEADGTITLI